MDKNNKWLNTEDKWTSPSDIVLEDQEDQDPGKIFSEYTRLNFASFISTLLGDEIEKEEKLLKNSTRSKDRQPTG